ncbi:hypothetical protein [Actinoplanes friuliensis]|jgi:hypothetical protein|uniref:Integral membrane protein n=1 Tax=Actinoplanes friuliensis DSM 7358 TaxID=1246995 RepID=U5VQU4_9ACTN|nr:hypothetical protein [Actinoplanes friuliensis]AGZ39177.1 hypothetical protein AFR_04440 [Actinoplanes friuliensis DSM 7358]
MTALVRMRLAGFLRSGRALAPIITALVVLGIIHGGGRSPAAPAYGYSAVMLFPILAWQTKLVLDAEPDVQRRLARLAVGARREAAAGLLAAAVLGLACCAVAMLIPWWPFHAISTPEPGTTSLFAGIAVGAFAHLLTIPAAVALGALASRAVTRTVRNGITVLVSGAVLAIVLGLSGSIAPWLVPPVMATARALAGDTLPSGGTLWLLTGWALAWCAAVLTGYARLRRSRS